MRRRGMSRLGSWLGVFAIAMLFIGPPIGQWRAQLALQQSAQAHGGQQLHPQPAAHAAHTGHSSHSGHSGHASHTEHAEPIAHAERTAAPAAAASRQHGVLQLDHCGYCHLVASFAALPAPLHAWPQLSSATRPWVAADYQPPTRLLPRQHQARAPPLPHA